MTPLKGMLIRHEAIRFKPYVDTKGKITIGVGRNLEDVGISADEAMMMLDNDIASARRDAHCFTWFGALDEPRKDVVLSMIFNMGLKKYLTFKGMIAAMQKRDFDRAASEMLNSLWAAQVGKRAAELAEMMRTGEYGD